MSSSFVISIYSPNSQFTWNYYFNNADQLLYNKPFVNEFLGREYYQTTNNLLFEAVVKDLNEKFPEEQWILGEIPLFHWRILNYPGYEPSDYEIAYWENNPNIHKEFGYYYEYYSQLTRCIYQKQFGEQVKKEQGNLKRLVEICNEARKKRAIYVIDREDNECSGGYDLGIKVNFNEKATETFYGTELTKQEQVINSTIVREIDSGIAGSEDMDIVHGRLETISSKLNSFLDRNKFSPSSNESNKTRE